MTRNTNLPEIVRSLREMEAELDTYIEFGPATLSGVEQREARIDQLRRQLPVDGGFSLR